MISHQRLGDGVDGALGDEGERVGISTVGDVGAVRGLLVHPIEAAEGGCEHGSILVDGDVDHRGGSAAREGAHDGDRLGDRIEPVEGGPAVGEHLAAARGAAAASGSARAHGEASAEPRVTGAGGAERGRAAAAGSAEAVGAGRGGAAHAEERQKYAGPAHPLTIGGVRRVVNADPIAGAGGSSGGLHRSRARVRSKMRM